jgi:hypothetical protein
MEGQSPSTELTVAPNGLTVIELAGPATLEASPVGTLYPSAARAMATPSATPGLVPTRAERFWYVVQCIMFGAGYFAKIPTKKALSDAGLCGLTSAEKFWYVLQCIFFGSGYFAKVPARKALSDAGVLAMTDVGQFWYVLMCIGFGSGYFAKVPMR